MDINHRLKIIEDLDKYLFEKKKILSDICDGLGWPEESLKEETKVQCPHNSGHWVPESSLARHVELCALVKDGYLKEEIEKQPPSSTIFYSKAPSVFTFTFDKETQARVLIEKGVIEKKPLAEMPDVPKTVDRCMVELNPEQRLAKYDYVISEAKAANKAENDTLEDLMFDFEKKNDQEDRPKTQLEILAEQRDYKRRRQSYRAKNVHITKKSYTEVMKEVIENQISMLTEMRKEENNERDVDSSKEEQKHDRKKRERSPSLREVSQDRHRYDSRDLHHSHYKRSKSQTPKKKKKHKHNRSRSRSRSQSRKHKKSHKSKKSHN